MKNLNLIFASFMMLIAATSCGTMKFATMEVQNPLKQEYQKDTDTKYRAIGMGESPDAQIAIDISRTKAYAILGEKINLDISTTTTQTDAQNDIYEEEGKSTDAAKVYKRKTIEVSRAIIEREAKQLQQEARYNKKQNRFYVWTAFEVSRRDRKEILKEME